MLSRLADLAVAHPRRMALLALLAVIVAGVFGGPAAGLLKASNAFRDPNSDSARAETIVERATGAEASPGVLAVVAAPPDSPAVASVARTIAGVRGVAAVAAPTAATAAAAAPTQGLVSADGRSSIVAATLHVGGTDGTVTRIEDALHGRTDVTLGGGDVAGSQTGKQATADLGFAELLAFPLLAILSLFIFRGVAALLPLGVGITSILGAFVVLRIVNAALPLSQFALNLVIGLGLGLAVDYSLFLVWRLREELGRGAPMADALRTTMVTTGRTILFSGATVAAAMACLTVFPQRFLVSMGIGGAIVALVAAASALLVLPALLVLLGGRVGRVHAPADTTGAWYRLAHAVMRRPILVAVATTALLLLLASPTPNVRWSGIDATVLPRSQSSRVVSDLLARDFPGANGGTAITVIATAPPQAQPKLAAYASRLARTVPGVALTQGPTRLAGGPTWEIKLGTRADAISPAAQRAVAAIRAVPAPVPVLVGVAAAAFADQRSAIADSLPLALVLLVVVTVLVLWLMTGSVILPFKTLVMNALSAAAATGILVFVFQDGRLTGPLSYTSQGGIEETDFLILAALAFALATDYGVFLLARIKEARTGGLGEHESIAAGLQRTGRIVTSAAILLAVAIGAFATSKIVFLKEVGVGTAAAVLIDAFVVRALLVPSMMALLGRWNWWSPAVLRRLHERIGLAEA
jgi:RND superfamily putative drug exporter